MAANTSIRTNKMEFFIGLITLFLLFGGILSLFLLSKYDVKDYKHYKVYFPFLDGLKDGSKVFYAGGIDIGYIEKISPDLDQGGALLEVKIRDDFTLTNKYRFVITSGSVLGGRYLNVEMKDSWLNGQEQEMPILENTVIPGVFKNGINEVVSEVYRLVETAENSLEALYNIIVGGQGASGLGNSVKILNQIMTKIDKLIVNNSENVEGIINKANQIIDSMNSQKGIVGRLINDNLLSVNIINIIRRLDQITSSLEGNNLINSAKTSTRERKVISPISPISPR